MRYLVADFPSALYNIISLYGKHQAHCPAQGPKTQVEISPKAIGNVAEVQSCLQLNTKREDEGIILIIIINQSSPQKVCQRQNYQSGYQAQLVRRRGKPVEFGGGFQIRHFAIY